MDQINLKILSNVFLVCIVLLIVAIIYVGVVGPYGTAEKIRLYNLEIMSALMVPLGTLIGSLFGILITKKNEK